MIGDGENSPMTVQEGASSVGEGPFREKSIVYGPISLTAINPTPVRLPAPRRVTG